MYFFPFAFNNIFLDFDGKEEDSFVKINILLFLNFSIDIIPSTEKSWIS